MKRALAVGLVLAAVRSVLAAPPPSPPVPDKPRAPNAGDFVYQSVLERLTEDGVSPVLAASLEQKPDFLPKCPLCQPTLRALSEYAKRKTAAAPKEGKGLPLELVKRLESSDNDVRRAALREMIAG